MKRTNKNLLDFFGLKIGQFIRVKVNPEYDMNYGDRIYEVIDSANGYLPIVQENQDWHLFLHMIIDNEWEYEIVDYKPTPKLTEDEKVELKLSKLNGCEWVFRNKNGGIFAKYQKPFKTTISDYWYTFSETTTIELDYTKFRFISWEDEEPYNIKELLDENSKRNV